MIFVAAGTKDGRELAGYLLQQGYEVICSVVSQYGKELLQSYKGIKINCEPLDVEGFINYFAEHDIKVFVDASHPYAVTASQNAMLACKRANVVYIRYERPQTTLDYPHAYYVENYQQAGEVASKLGDNIFLTTGSRNLEAFAKAECLKDKKLICRILPEPEVVQLARDLGFLPADIIALQGPFSLELNKELYKKYNADVVVTKNSGTTGGTDTKFSAAMEMNLPIVIIDRPKIVYENLAEDFTQILELIKKVWR